MSRGKIRSLSCTVIVSGLLVGCSYSEEKVVNQPTIETTTQSSVTVDSPQLNEQGMVTVSPQEDIMDSFNNSSQEVRDQWYVTQLKDSGLSIKDRDMMTLRDIVCGLLDQEVTADNLSHRMSQMHETMTDKQKGVVIAASMVSSCPTASLSVRESVMPTP